MKIKKHILFVFIASFLLIAMFSLVMAEQPEDNTINKNMTYGQCVTKGVEIKNTCYSSVKSVKSVCEQSAGNTSETKRALKICDSGYKTVKTQCKNDFKSAKKECKKIKHNFFETLKYSFA